MRYKGGVALKRFASEKQHQNSPTKSDPQAEGPTLDEKDTAIAVSTDASAPPKPDQPLVKLSKMLGCPVPNSADSFFPNGLITKEDTAFWAALNRKAESLLQLIDSSDPENPLSANTQLEVHITYDWSAAFGLLIPPAGKGQALSVEALIAQAEEAGIKYGLDTHTLSNMIENEAWFQVFPLAAGKPVKNGADGRIEELYPREKRISLQADENEVVDFKNLNWLQCVHKGDVICNVFPPTEPEDGCDIGGNVIKGHEGRMPRLPRGKNIIESED